MNQTEQSDLRVHQTAVEQRLIKALAHPLRQRILVQLNEHEASPSALAERLGEPLGNVSYHVKILLENGAIELVRTKPARGAIEHFYRATARPYIDDDHFTKLPLTLRRGLFDAALQDVWNHVVEAAERNGFDHPESHVSWTALDLDAQGFSEVVELLGETLDRALQIQAEAAGRMAERSGGEDKTERTELAILHYHRPRVGDP